MKGGLVSAWSQGCGAGPAWSLFPVSPPCPGEDVQEDQHAGGEEPAGVSLQKTKANKKIETVLHFWCIIGREHGRFLSDKSSQGHGVCEGWTWTRLPRQVLACG